MNELSAKLNWIGCAKHGGSGKNNDVSLTIVKYSDQHNAISISMRNSVFELLGDNVDYIELAIYKNRVFFKASDINHGLLLKGNKQTVSSTRYARISAECDVKHFIPFAGDYELKHDDFYDLYYIENKDMNTN